MSFLTDMFSSGAGEAVSSGVGEAASSGIGEAASSGLGEAVGSSYGDLANYGGEPVSLGQGSSYGDMANYQSSELPAQSQTPVDNRYHEGSTEAERGYVKEYKPPANTTKPTNPKMEDFKKQMVSKLFSSIKSSDMPGGMKGVAEPKSGKYTPGLVGPNTPRGIKPVKGSPNEAFNLSSDDLKKFQAGLDEAAKNRADRAGFAAENKKYAPTEGSSYEPPPSSNYEPHREAAPAESSEWTDENWKDWTDNYYSNGYDKWPSLQG